MKKMLCSFVMTAVLCGSAVPLMAQLPPPPPPPPRAVVPSGTTTEAAGTLTPAPSNGVTEEGISFHNTPLQSVVETLASVAKLRLIIPEPLAGSITMELPGIDAKDALRSILESKNYTLVEDKNGIFTVQAKAAETPEVEVFTLNYTSVADLVPAITTMLTPRGKLQPTGNSIIVSDVHSNLEKIAAIVKQLDTKTPQVLIEARLYEVIRDPKKQLGVDWSRTLGGNGFETKFGGSPDTNGNITPFLFDFGLTGAKHLPSTAVLTQSQFDVVLTFLNADTDTELIATPRVVTADNREATIKIVDEEPIPNFTFNSQTAAFEISGFTFKDVGNTLKVTPHVNKDGFITLDLSPEVSNIAAFRTFSGSPASSNSVTNNGSTAQAGGGSGITAQIPVIDVRTVSTRVLLKNGDTLAIGGLTQTTKANTYNKVPVIGDVPVLGLFFRNKSLETVKQTLLMFITPTELKPGDKTGYEDQVEGLKQGEVYVDDIWMPHDNAKPYGRYPVRQEDLQKEGK